MRNDSQVETGIKQGVLYGYDSGFVTGTWSSSGSFPVVSTLTCKHAPNPVPWTQTRLAVIDYRKAFQTRVNDLMISRWTAEHLCFWNQTISRGLFICFTPKSRRGRHFSTNSSTSRGEFSSHRQLCSWTNSQSSNFSLKESLRAELKCNDDWARLGLQCTAIRELWGSCAAGWPASGLWLQIFVSSFPHCWHFSAIVWRFSANPAREIRSGAFGEKWWQSDHQEGRHRGFVSFCYSVVLFFLSLLRKATRFSLFIHFRTC